MKVSNLRNNLYQEVAVLKWRHANTGEGQHFGDTIYEVNRLFHVTEVDGGSENLQESEMPLMNDTPPPPILTSNNLVEALSY